MDEILNEILVWSFEQSISDFEVFYVHNWPVRSSDFSRKQLGTLSSIRPAVNVTWHEHIQTWNIFYFGITMKKSDSKLKID